MPGQRRSPLSFGLPGTSFLLSALLFVGLGAAKGQEATIPDDPQRGVELLFAKGCVSCHSIFSERTGTEAASAKRPIRRLGGARLAAAMWNHAPQMWERMQQERREPPSITREEMAAIVAFVYSMRHFDEPGNPQKGRQLLATRSCIDCHSIDGSGDREAPDLSAAARFANPLLWIQTMWNHAPYMEELMQERALDWPELGAADLIDIFSYVRDVSPPQKRRVDLLPADPGRGEILFTRKRCSACHSVEAIWETAASAAGGLPETLTQFAALMWNHEPAMRREMADKKIDRPDFSEREMADLIAFLYAARFAGPAGTEAAGERLFAEKQCATCHSVEAGTASPAPEGAHLPPISFFHAMWNHGVEMFAHMREKGVPWPRFEEREMADLLAYLRRHAISTGSD